MDMKDIVEKEECQKSRAYSVIGFMAVYGSMQVPKNQNLNPLRYIPSTDWSTDIAEVHCDGYTPATDACKKRKSYYRKRRYCCPGQRRYKAKTSGRCCLKSYNNKRINLCNRNWARISVYPFINFLRCYRKKFSKYTPPEEIARKGRCVWRKMSCRTKGKYYEQAKRARIRGYRT